MYFWCFLGIFQSDSWWYLWQVFEYSIYDAFCQIHNLLELPIIIFKAIAKCYAPDNVTHCFVHKIVWAKGRTCMRCNNKENRGLLLDMALHALSMFLQESIETKVLSDTPNLSYYYELFSHDSVRYPGPTSLSGDKSWAAAIRLLLLGIESKHWRCV